MSAITIKNLPARGRLDLKAMSALRGAGGEWVYGWIRPYVDGAPSFGPVVNFYQINNSYHADQMNNQIQVVAINNSAPNSNISVALDEHGANFKRR